MICYSVWNVTTALFVGGCIGYLINQCLTLFKRNARKDE